MISILQVIYIILYYYIVLYCVLLFIAVLYHGKAVKYKRVNYNFR